MIVNMINALTISSLDINQCMALFKMVRWSNYKLSSCMMMLSNDDQRSQPEFDHHWIFFIMINTFDHLLPLYDSDLQDCDIITLTIVIKSLWWFWHFIFIMMIQESRAKLEMLEKLFHITKTKFTHFLYVLYQN